MARKILAGLMAGFSSFTESIREASVVLLKVFGRRVLANCASFAKIVALKYFLMLS